MKILDVKKIRKDLHLTQSKLAEKLGVNIRTVQKWESGETKMSGETVLAIQKLEYEQKGVKSSYKKESESPLILNELSEKVYNGQTEVKIISINAQAGWSENYYSQEYIKDLPTILIESDENYKGEYLAFEVQGESMEPEYYAGDIVICREVQRHLWSYKLHYKDWDFVIGHAKNGIMLKEITNHDVGNGIITCHSLHPNHNDFNIDLREVAHLYNVVEVRQKGRSKRRNR